MMKSIKPWFFIITLALLAGCSWPGSQGKSTTDVTEEGTEKVEATHDLDVKTTKPTPLIDGDLILGKEAKFEIKYEGAPPRETTETKSEKVTKTSSFMDYTLRDVHEKVSGLYWLMVLVACAGFWLLFKSIVNSKEFAAARGGLNVAKGVMSFVTNQLETSKPGDADHIALTKVKNMMQETSSDLTARSHPRHFSHR